MQNTESTHSTPLQTTIYTGLGPCVGNPPVSYNCTGCEIHIADLTQEIMEEMRLWTEGISDKVIEYMLVNGRCCSLATFALQTILRERNAVDAQATACPVSESSVHAPFLEKRSQPYGTITVSALTMFATHGRIEVRSYD
jgi:hypothetical protein